MISTQLRCACAASALALALAFGSPAQAQVGGATSPQDATQAGIRPAGLPDNDQAASPSGPDIVVTGSLIRGSPEDAAAPIDVIGADEIAKQGNPSAVELLKALPVSSGVLGDSNQFDSRAQGTGGIASVNLRGLGPARSLVLLNSKRLASTGVGQGATDINLLPLAAIGRVELLKDGGAATYGSDAVAGVINFITRTDQEGFQAAGSYKYVKSTDGDFDGSLSYGHKGDGFRVLAAVGFQKRGELLARDREFTRLGYAQNPEGGWTGGGNPANFIALGAGGVPINVTGPTGITGSIQPDSSCTAVGGFVGAPKAGYPLGQCFTKYSPYDSLIELEKRGQAFIDFEANIAGDSKLEVTMLYGRDTVPHGLTSPTYLLTQRPSSVGYNGTNPTPFVGGFYVPASNPGFAAYRSTNPTALPATATGAVFPTLLYRPYLSGGNPLFLDDSKESGASRGQTKNERFRVTVDLTGKVTSGINYDFGVTYDDYNHYFDGRDSFGDRVQLALLGFGGPNCSGSTPGANGCQFLNPFGNAISVNPATGQTNAGANGPANTASLASWIFQRGSTVYDTEIFVADGQVSGSTGIKLPGGEVQFGLGGQYRKTWFETKLSDNNNILFTPCRETPINGNANPAACAPNPGSTAFAPANGANAFLGTGLPVSLNQDVYAVFGEIQIPVFDTVNLQGAARYEDYGAGIGSTFNPQGRVRWQVADWLALRGGVGTTFRGPSAANTSPTRVTTLQLIGSTFTPTDTFGNASLKPETSTNYSAGVIINFGGFQASADYFKYKLKDSIVTDPLSSMVATLFPTGLPNTCAANPGLAARFTFTTGACTAATTTANVARASLLLQNGPEVQNSGVDFIANYRERHMFNTDLRFGVGVTATYSIEDKIGAVFVAGTQVSQPYDGVGLLNYQKTLYPLPKWKGQGYVDLGTGPLDGRFTVNYSDGLHDQRFDEKSGPFAPNPNIAGSPILSQGANINEFITADFNLSLKVMNRFTITGTVFNIFDANPPFAREDYDYEPFVGNPYGRMFKIGVAAQF